MVMFLVPALWLQIKALTLLTSGQMAALSTEFGPDTPEAELKAELEDLQRR
jgi:hypothetical protein